MPKKIGVWRRPGGFAGFPLTHLPLHLGDLGFGPVPPAIFRFKLHGLALPLLSVTTHTYLASILPVFPPDLMRPVRTLHGRKATNLYIINVTGAVHNKKHFGLQPEVNAREPVAQWMSRYAVTVAGADTDFTLRPQQRRTLSQSCSAVS